MDRLLTQIKIKQPMKKRRKFTAEFKSKVALEALREQHPIHKIAKRHQIHPSQVTEWKKALLGNASTVFEKASSRNDEKKRLKSKEDKLHKQIGQLHMEVDFLKEACEELGIGVPENDFS